MSGEKFDYSEFSLLDIRRAIQKIIDEGVVHNYSSSTIDEFKEIFHRRLKENLKKDEKEVK